MTRILLLLVASLCLATTVHAGEMTMKQVMQQLHTDFTRLNDAILMDDMQAAAVAAHGIANHAPPALSRRQQIKKALGTSMADFKAADMVVHGLAVKIAKAATAGDRDAVIRHQSAMLGACSGCHNRFRAQVSALFK